MTRAAILLKKAGAIPADLTACEAALAVADRIAALRGRRFPAVVGLNGAQGSGKSTLAALVALALENLQHARTATLSLDDFYLPKADRQRLARDVHPMCATRGVPGTHDCPLLMETFSRLLAATPESRTPIPVFSKLADDRADPVAFEGRPDAILFEGWCVGLSADLVPQWRAPINALEREADRDGAWHRWSRAELERAYTPFWKMLDLLVTVMQPPTIRSVVESRLRQERGLAGDAPRMDEAQVERFVQHYERYTLALWDAMPRVADIVIRRDREFKFSVEQRGA